MGIYKQKSPIATDKTATPFIAQLVKNEQHSLLQHGYGSIS
jgi:hypothetical protein